MGKKIQNPQIQKIKVETTEELRRGVYANKVGAGFSREDFVMDFILLMLPSAFLNARVIMTPGNFKNMVKELQNTLMNYEKKWGTIKEATAPQIKMPKGVETA